MQPTTEEAVKQLTDAAPGTLGGAPPKTPRDRFRKVRGGMKKTEPKLKFRATQTAVMFRKDRQYPLSERSLYEALVEAGKKDAELAAKKNAGVPK